MKLALFDLDHTLLPIDSDYSWGQFTTRIGWTDPVEFSRRNDEFFALCDNRKASNDSRIWGPVSADRVKGKAILRYWPLNKFGRP